MSEHKTFRHAGDLGDILFSLPIARYFGGGKFYIEAAPFTRVRLTPDRWCGIDRVLAAQPYITGVEPWTGSRVDYNINDFRVSMHPQVARKQNIDRHLMHWMMDRFNVPRDAANEAWITIPDPVMVKRVVVSRSGPGRHPKLIYHNWKMPWNKIGKRYGTDAVFVGTEHEHQAFCATCFDLPWQPTEDLYEAAQVIAGADLFIGNQSAPHALASGMKKRIILEVWEEGPNCLDIRPGVTNIRDYNTELQDL